MEKQQESKRTAALPITDQNKSIMSSNGRRSPAAVFSSTPTSTSTCSSSCPSTCTPTTSNSTGGGRPARGEHRVYGTRFWILAMFCLLSCLTCWQWNTWGPISESMAKAYPGWGASRVALMPNLSMLVFVVFVWPVCWAVDKVGLRPAVVLTCVLTTAALALRCVAQEPALFTILCYVSASLLGVTLTVVMVVPPVVAALWFPPEERATAQGLVFASEQLGVLVSYLEPLVVRLPGPNTTIHHLRHDITLLMYISTGICAALSLAIFLHFPHLPPTPPSLTASYNRTTFKEGVATFTRNRDLWMMLGCYFVCTGPCFGWVTVLDYSLLPLGMHQDEAMWVGGAAILFSATAALASGRYTDAHGGNLKSTLVVMLLLSSGAFYWFLLLSEGVIPFSKWQVYVSVVAGISLNFACLPVFYELAQELWFPCPEVVVGGVVATADNIAATAFLFAYQIPRAGFRWVPYVLVVTSAVVVLPIMSIRVHYTRATLDDRADRHSHGVDSLPSDATIATPQGTTTPTSSRLGRSIHFEQLDPCNSNLHHSTAIVGDRTPLLMHSGEGYDSYSSIGS